MAKQSNPLEGETQNKTSVQAQELGLTDSYGSFPVWMLKIIHSVTPDFLIQKKQPKNKPSQK
ncbi:MAG: hypothetical protein VYC17_05615 [Nitrospinota bacterium]|nr:hypothetical protein [Nitrospinota bacterium]